MTVVRALLRPHRIELVSSGVLAVVMLTLGIGAALRMAAFGIPRECFGPAAPAMCTVYTPGPIEAYRDALGLLLPPAFGATLAVPMIAAVVVGLALIARELEQQTTVLAWSLSPSRVGWLLRRVVPVGAGLVLLGLVAGALGDLLELLRSPTVDPWRSLDELGARGPSVAAAALLAFGIAVLVGSALGRQLPTLLVAGGLIVGVLFGVGQLTDVWLNGDAVVGLQSEIAAGDRELDGMLRTPAGEFINWDVAYGRYGSDLDTMLAAGSDANGDFGNGFAYAARYVPGEMYPIATARITVILGVLGVLSIAGSALVLNRRRPY